MKTTYPLKSFTRIVLIAAALGFCLFASGRAHHGCGSIGITKICDARIVQFEDTNLYVRVR